MTLDDHVKDTRTQEPKPRMTFYHIAQGLALGLGGSLALGVLVEQGLKQLHMPPMSAQDRSIYYTVISFYGAYFGLGFFSRMMYLREVYYRNKKE